MIDSFLLFYIIIGFFVFLFLVIGLIMLVFWKRRKWTFTNFLNESGKWTRVHWKKLDKEFEYKGIIYEYDVRYATRDEINRPIAHYYLGNPKQQLFNYSLSDKNINIGTEEIKPKDLRQMMMTKIIKDLFSDDDYKTWFIIILCVMIVGFIIILFMLNSGSNECILTMNNQTIQVISEGVKNAIKTKV